MLDMRLNMVPVMGRLPWANHGLRWGVGFEPTLQAVIDPEANRALRRLCRVLDGDTQIG